MSKKMHSFKNKGHKALIPKSKINEDLLYSTKMGSHYYGSLGFAPDMADKPYEYNDGKEYYGT